MQTGVNIQALSCRLAWWQTSCHWRKCFLFHSMEIQFWASFCWPKLLVSTQKDVYWIAPIKKSKHYCGMNLLVILFINVQAQSIHSQPQLRSLLIFDVEVIDSIHLEVLSDFQILHHWFLPADEYDVFNGGLNRQNVSCCVWWLQRTQQKWSTFRSWSDSWTLCCIKTVPLPHDYLNYEALTDLHNKTELL